MKATLIHVQWQTQYNGWQKVNKKKILGSLWAAPQTKSEIGMLICPCRQNVNVWRAWAGLMRESFVGGFSPTAIFKKCGFAWFHNANTATSKSVSNRRGNFLSFSFFWSIFSFCELTNVESACLVFLVLLFFRPHNVMTLQILWPKT